MWPQRLPPGVGQESVWDYPRPPRLEKSTKLIRVVYAGITIAASRRTLRILETSHPPVYYIPPEDVHMEYLTPTSRHTFCEFKGYASYYTVSIGDQTAMNAAWYYPRPTQGYEDLGGAIAFYPSRMEACYVDDELVRAQAGDFYGGWITAQIVGPFKGDAGTLLW